MLEAKRRAAAEADAAAAAREVIVVLSERVASCKGYCESLSGTGPPGGGFNALMGINQQANASGGQKTKGAVNQPPAVLAAAAAVAAAVANLNAGGDPGKSGTASRRAGVTSAGGGGGGSKPGTVWSADGRVHCASARGVGGRTGLPPPPVAASLAPAHLSTVPPVAAAALHLWDQGPGNAGGNGNGSTTATSSDGADANNGGTAAEEPDSASAAVNAGVGGDGDEGECCRHCGHSLSPHSQNGNNGGSGKATGRIARNNTNGKRAIHNAKSLANNNCKSVSSHGVGSATGQRGEQGGEHGGDEQPQEQDPCVFTNCEGVKLRLQSPSLRAGYTLTANGQVRALEHYLIRLKASTFLIDRLLLLILDLFSDFSCLILLLLFITAPHHSSSSRCRPRPRPSRSRNKASKGSSGRRTLAA